MRTHEIILQEGLIGALESLYNYSPEPNHISINTTRKEFAGDYTIVLFPFLKPLKTNPIKLGDEVGKYLVEHVSEVKDFNVVKGFLNISLSDDYWYTVLKHIAQHEDFGKSPAKGIKTMVEFSSPNTNKPLHLGHIRNISLGWSCAKILAKAGHEVLRVQIVNDRGIAICKSMLAWQKYANGATPESTGTKSDHFVGEYYVAFESQFKQEYESWSESEEGRSVIHHEKKEGEDLNAFKKRYKNTYFNQHSMLGQEAKTMLLKWEAGDPDTLALWRRMNQWVYDGFNQTYQSLGVEFDKLYYESDTYLLGKDAIEKGLEKGHFYRKEDGSVWVDLEEEGFDQKILLRSDGTSVYMTQDIGTAMQRYEDAKPNSMVYVVGDEQDYHFQVLFEILKRLEEPYSDRLFHLSYGMIELPDGRMKSREGTVVDADHLLQDVYNEAKAATLERGELPGETVEEGEQNLRNITLGAIKFYILKVTPKKKMIYNPKESLDMQGQTGPYIQNAYVRIKSILRKTEKIDLPSPAEYVPATAEKELLQLLASYPQIIEDSAAKYDPSDIANYSYQLAKSFHRFYHDFRILSAESPAAKNFRLQLIVAIADVLKSSFDLLGIPMPERM